LQAIQQFFHQLGRQFGVVWDLFTSWLISIFDPQSGWEPKAIFGAVLLFIVFWISKRGTKS
jgi:hypothetical protein